MKTTVVLLALVGLGLVSFASARECRPEEDLMHPPPCPGTGPNSTYFPYPYDCRKFYECTPDGNAKCFFCDETLVWDDVLKTCNYEFEVGCNIVTTSGPPTTTEPTTTTTTPTTTTPTTTTPTTTTPTTTTPTTTTPTTTTPTTTTPTTTTTTTTEPPTTTTTTTEPPTTTTGSTTTDPADPINWVCPRGYVGLVAHPYDCKLFFNCDPARRPCLFECQPSTFFDPAKAACDFEYLVDYCKGGTPPPGSPTPFMSSTTSATFNYRTAKKSFIAQVVDHRQDDPCVPFAVAPSFFGR